MNPTIALWLLVTASSGAAADPPKDGKEAFVAQKCVVCHSVETLDIKATRPPEAGAPIDVSGMSVKYKADQLMRYLKKEEKFDGRAHPPKFKGTDETLDQLVKWLMTIKPAPKKG